MDPIYKNIIKEHLESVLRRHTWMMDGTTYVGNGTYTLAKAQEMMERDYPEIYGVSDEKVKEQMSLELSVQDLNKLIAVLSESYRGDAITFKVEGKEKVQEIFIIIKSN